MKYNGRKTVAGQDADEWFLNGEFPYGPFYYWNTPGTLIPLQFRGPSTVNTTTLQYTSYEVYQLPEELSNPPILKTCTEQCFPNPTVAKKVDEKKSSSESSGHCVGDLCS